MTKELIERIITLSGELSPQYRTRLLKIAKHGPLHRTLRSGLRAT